MKDDKRLNEVIRVKKSPNNFVMINKSFLENTELSWKAKGILAYLLSKPDNWKVIVKDIMNHSTDGKTAVYNGLNELKESGYYEKTPIRDDRGAFIRWESTVYESPEAINPENKPSYPLPGNPEMDKPEMDNPYMENRERNNNYLSNIDSSNNYESESAPAPVQKYGKFDKVRLTVEQYNELVTAYGEAKTNDYISQLDSYIKSTGKRYPDHYATIERWIERDNKKQPAAQPIPKANKFINFKQRDWDDEIKRLEQMQLSGI